MLFVKDTLRFNYLCCLCAAFISTLDHQYRRHSYQAHAAFFMVGYCQSCRFASTQSSLAHERDLRLQFSFAYREVRDLAQARDPAQQILELAVGSTRLVLRDHVAAQIDSAEGETALFPPRSHVASARRRA